MVILKRSLLDICRLKNLRKLSVLGIETSCDDTCAAIVNSDKRVLSSRRITKRDVQTRLGGISPFTSAVQHRTHLDEIVAECLAEAQLRPSDLNAVAVTTSPGLVLSLKVGCDKAAAMCREYSLDFIPIHHMRAHALTARLIYEVPFPFLCLLISGAHAIFCIVRSAENFEILGETTTMSPGEAIDKVVRETGEESCEHWGAVAERIAKLHTERTLKYVNTVPNPPGANMDFTIIRNLFVSALRRNPDVNLPNFFFNLQLIIVGHICQKLDFIFRYLHENEEFKTTRNLVISGGVAANEFICGAVRKVSNHYGFQLKEIPKKLTSDNAEMVAWNGIELINEGSSAIIPYSNPPSLFYVSRRMPIGIDKTEDLIRFVSPQRLKISSLYPPDADLQFRNI